MSGRARSPEARTEGDPFDAAGLAELGLSVGEQVRFTTAGRPRPATVRGRERDGSVALVDANGSSRSVAPDRLLVARTGPRGGRGWEPLGERLARHEQRRLL
ncbi:MAG: hypothetical protein JJU45_01955 [Acidimicrobiia bacterium]|nr:hypothetical protein [Acidimicrobiia bacterium]